MSEEEKKERPKAHRIISIISLCIGIPIFLSGLSMVLAVLWFCIIPGAGEDSDVTGMFLIIAAFLSFIYFWIFWPIPVIGLVLSIVTLFIERNMLLRLLPLAFSIVGICICAMFYVIVIAVFRIFGG
jgi:hypothetical protein